MAGYNTTTEILRSGKRAILIPCAGPSAEQRMRAQLFAARGWVEMLDPDDLHADSVAEMVLDNLSQGPMMTAELWPDMHGLTSAAEHLVSLVKRPAVEEPFVSLPGAATCIPALA